MFRLGRKKALAGAAAQDDVDDDLVPYPVSPKMAKAARPKPSQSFSSAYDEYENSESNRGWSDESEDSAAEDQFVEEIAQGEIEDDKRVGKNQQHAPNLFDSDEDSSEEEFGEDTVGDIKDGKREGNDRQQQAPNMFDSDEESSESDDEYSSSVLKKGNVARAPLAAPHTPNSTKKRVVTIFASPHSIQGEPRSPRAAVAAYTSAGSPVAPSHRTASLIVDEVDHPDDDFIDDKQIAVVRSAPAPAYDRNGNLVPGDINSDSERSEELDKIVEDPCFATHWNGRQDTAVHRADGSFRSSRSSRRGPGDSLTETQMEEGRANFNGNSSTMSMLSFAMETQKRDRRMLIWLGICLGCSMVGLAGVVGVVLGSSVFHDKVVEDDTNGGTPLQPTPVSPASPTTAPTAPVATPPPVAAPAMGAITPVPTPVVAETAPPTATGAFNIVNQALYDLVSAASTDTGLSIQQVDSPQNRAYKWLENDSIQEGLSDAAKLQRYALSCFYFSTHGENWTNAAWIDGVSECAIFTCLGETLTVLEMNQRNVQGVLPPELGLLTGLTRLAIMNSLVGPGMSGGIPKELGNLTQMREFGLQGNSFTEPIPPELFEKWSLCEDVGLDSNGFSGSIPTTIGNLVAATRINMGTNRLTGKIPDEIQSLASILQLTLSENQLTGPIPTSVGLLTTIKGVNFDNNLLSGTIPTEFGSLILIKGGLDLSINKLTGTVPASLAALPDMKLLHLYNNELTGTIPDFSPLINLKSFRIDGNLVNGTVPAGTCTAIALRGADAYADCPGEIVCTCCNYCCDSAGVCLPV
jgi:hypothetical protein